MAILNHDNHTLSNGVVVSDTYICISNNTIRIQKISNGLYQINASYQIYLNETAKNENKAPLNDLSISFNVPENSLNQNVYTLSYNEIKSIYPNYSDVV